jgi:hypothetical protein
MIAAPGAVRKAHILVMKSRPHADRQEMQQRWPIGWDRHALGERQALGGGVSGNADRHSTGIDSKDAKTRSRPRLR